ncbi:MAG: lytic murein transglycosylase [Burkholderiales bacterium]|jgi:lytic murein transglycosylase|nr:lytic murein transglycosylase [Burkholderiales bacterium]
MFRTLRLVVARLAPSPLCRDPRRLALGLLAIALTVAAPASADPLQKCLADLRAQAPRNRVSTEDFDRLTANVRILERVIASRASQAEVVDFWWDYVPRMVDDRRTRDGRELTVRWNDAMSAIEQRYGVDRSVFTAIWGIETNYGASQSSLPLLDVWVTRACTEQRPLWRANVYASLRLLRDGTVKPEDLVGSWGGAFGLTQFIPTSYEELAVDGDGDGRADLVRSVPDALASTANHLTRRTRWVSGLAPAIEVRVPAELTRGVRPTDETWRKDDARTLSQWAKSGVTAANGQPLAGNGDARASLFFPAGAEGPAFLVTQNFDALLAYNVATKYALSVALLANRIAGADRTLVRPWPTDDPGLDRDGIRQLQELLLARGHDIGVADGIPGPRTRDAVRAEQRRLGLPEDGRTGERTLKVLQGTAAAPARRS